jgi:hypothetical protein
MRTPLGAGNPVCVHDQVRPKSSDWYKAPPFAAIAMTEPMAAMQPVSATPSIHTGNPPLMAVIDPSGWTGRL